VIAIRVAESDADLEAWRRVFMRVVPNERALTVAQMRATSRAGQMRLLAEVDGAVVGSANVGPSDLPDAAFVAPRVVAPARRQGVGTELLRAVAAHAATLGVAYAQANVDDAGSLAFAGRFGFVEVDRQVEQVRAIGTEPVPQVPAGVSIVSVAQHPSLWRSAYESVGAQAFQDMAVVTPLEVTLEQWETEWIAEPEAMFIALAGDEVIGCAGLMSDQDVPHRAENALTAVRRDWRGRGVASALKRAALAWAAAHEITEVYTWTQRGNDDMRRLNEHLGYVTRMESVLVRAPLPLAAFA
jgi:GNAT superfamily N-acetyltransferase